MPLQSPLAVLRNARWLWLALLLAVFGAVTPVVSRAMEGGASGALEVCTSTGMAWVDAHGTATQDTGTGTGAPMAQCLWCQLANAPVGPVRATEGGVLWESVRHSEPVVREPVARPAITALTPRPRGPPAFHELLIL
jgi:hypothetical protein